MRIVLIAAALVIGAPLAASTVPPAAAQTSSGPQTDKPSDSSGGHECESKKKEQVTS
jgi:hypothetical protein